MMRGAWSEARTDQQLKLCPKISSLNESGRGGSWGEGEERGWQNGHIVFGSRDGLDVFMWTANLVESVVLCDRRRVLKMAVCPCVFPCVCGMFSLSNAIIVMLLWVLCIFFVMCIMLKKGHFILCTCVSGSMEMKTSKSYHSCCYWRNRPIAISVLRNNIYPKNIYD